MRTALWTIAGVLVGLLVAFILVIAVEAFGSVAHPFPEDFGGTPEELNRHVERFPAWVLAVAAIAWAVAAFASAWTANRIGGIYSVAIVGLVLLVMLVFNISILPYPLWFKIATLLLIPMAIVVGGRLWIGRRTAIGEAR